MSYLPYPRVTTGNIFTTLDAAIKNTVGGVWAIPANAGLVPTSKGYGAQLVVKYVYYNSTTNPAPVAASAPVYFTDESFTTVSGNAAEAFFTTGGACCAGYLAPNTTAISGLTPTQLNQSYCFIVIGGLLAGAYAPTTATGPGAGSYIVGATTGNWTSIVNTTQAASTRTLAVQWTAIASAACDVLVGGDSTFWGS